MMFRHKLLAGFLAAASLSAYAEEPILVTSEGLSLKITDSGFDLFSQIAKDEFINRLQNQGLPDQEMTIPLISRVRLEGIKFSVNLKKLSVSPAPGAMDLDAVVDNIEINIGHIRFENYFLPAIGTSCYETQVDVGNHQDLPVGANIAAMIGDPDFPIELKLQDLRFDLERGQYAAKGPGDCRGPFNIQDYFTRFIVRNLLGIARPAIEAAVKVEVVKTIPKVEKALNDMANVMLPLQLPDVAIVPASSFNIGFKPYALDITNEHLIVKLTLRIQANDTESLAIRNGIGLEYAQVVYGSFGINPEFLNSFMTVAMPNGSLERELLPESHQFIDIQTQRTEVAAFFPDLTATRVDSDRLRLFMRFVKAPLLSLDPTRGAIVADIPELEMKYKIQRDSEWLDYSIMTLKGKVAFAPKVEGGKAQIKVLEGAEVTATGRWAPGYTPVDTTINAQAASDTYTALLFLLSRRTAPPIEFPIPELPIAGHVMTVDGLRVEQPFVALDLVEAQR